MYQDNELIDEKDNSTPEKLSLAEEAFKTLQIHSTGFKSAFFTNNDLRALSLTSRTIGTVASAELRQRKLAHALLTYVVLGEQEQAKALIEEKPELLFCYSQTVDYSGRTIIGTAFQAAIGAGDKPMWEMMLTYFENLAEGEAKRQFDEQFPNGIEEDVSANELQNYYNTLAVAVSNHEDHGLSAIEEFRNEINSQNEIRQGKHFNMQHIVAACQAYTANFGHLSKRANWDHRNFFWQKVIGYLQRQMTAYDAQVYCSGLKGVSDNELNFKRKFKFYNGRDFFPLSADSGLGFDFAIQSTYAYALKYAGGVRGLMPELDQNYIELKQTHLLDLESRLSRECTIRPS